MARNIAAETGEVHRAVIVRKSGVTWYEGVYTKAAAAKARITFWTNYLKDSPDPLDTEESRVEVAAVVVWEKVD
jgi:hypothetical protein